MKRLINILNFIGASVLGVVDAFWSAADAIFRPRQESHLTPPRGQFTKTL